MFIYHRVIFRFYESISHCRSDGTARTAVISKPIAFDPNENSDVVIAASMVTPLEKD